VDRPTLSSRLAIKEPQRCHTRRRLKPAHRQLNRECAVDVIEEHDLRHSDGQGWKQQVPRRHLVLPGAAGSDNFYIGEYGCNPDHMDQPVVPGISILSLPLPQSLALLSRSVYRKRRWLPWLTPKALDGDHP
jgi:hypothetical protein